jgi:Fe2+ or Zn2+ uptake regulation protein
MNYVEIYNRNRVQYLYELARCHDLDAVAVRVGLLFATFLQPEDREEVRPKYEWLLKNAKIGSRSTLSKALGQLEARGFLHRIKYEGFCTFYSMPFDGFAEWKRCSPENGPH